MQLIYYAHSYRPIDNPINEFFQELMVDEALTPSLDPQSDRLYTAKPERHLRSTDTMVVVLPQRDPTPSEYIRWEIGLGLRARRPQLVFVEDTLADDLVPQGILQRRFSRRQLLREVRDHRAAVRTLKSYIGTDPPPTYHPTSLRRRCAVIGGSQFGSEPLKALLAYLEKCNYSPVVVKQGQENQLKLVELIEEGYFQNGLERKFFKNLRFISSSSEDLREKVSQGRFSEDLYYQLNTVFIRIPPLRERAKEIAKIAQYVLTEHSKKMKTKKVGFSNNV